MEAATADLAAAVLASLGMGTWLVPAAVLAGPGLLVIIAIMLQAGGGLIWVPFIRRRIGGFGLSRPKKPGRTRATT